MARFVAFVLAVITIVAVWLRLEERKHSHTTSGPVERPHVAKRPWPGPAPASETAEVAKTLDARNYYVVFDGSGSMDERACNSTRPKIDIAREALTNFAKSLPESANLGLFVFDNAGISERQPMASGNRADFIASVRQVIPGGGTPLATAIMEAGKQLEHQARKQLSYGEYHLVIVTDGEASDGEDPRSAVEDLLVSSPVVIHTIGFCIGGDHSLNQPGRLVYKAADDPEGLVAGLKDVLAEAESFDAVSYK